MEYETQLEPRSADAIDWAPTFEAQLAELTAPFSGDDHAQLAGPFVNPATTVPDPLQHFLRWAAGRDFSNGERQWAPIFTPRQIREYLIEYAFPVSHPTKLPIGMDGGGCFYVVDLATATLATYLVDPGDPIAACGLLASSLWDAIADGRSQIAVAGL